MPKRVFSTAIAAIVAVGAAAGARSASQQYLDPLGDATCCLDIAAVTVSNDVDGMLTFRVELPMAPAADTSSNGSASAEANGNGHLAAVPAEPGGEEEVAR